MLEKDQLKIWYLIEEWSKNSYDATKAELRERIRQFAFTRRSRNRKLDESTRDRAHEAYDILQPKNPVISYSWMFASNWVQESIDEIEDEEFDYRKREERIDKLRLEAMIEIWSERGFEGVMELIAISGAAGVIGRYALFCVTDVKQRVDFIRQCLSIDGDLRSKIEWCLQGFILSIEEDLRDELLQVAAHELPFDEQKRLFICAPFQASTWLLLDGFGEEIQKSYWKEVIPSWGRHTPSELTKLIDCLLETGCPARLFMPYKWISMKLKHHALRGC